MSIEEIRAEWNTDAFVIDPRLLVRKCRELANQQINLARRLKQPFDITAEKLVALYKKQRGRCAISGCPLTYSPGDRDPTSINLDHIVDIQRGKSLDAVAAGGSSVGGNAGMMDNIRFVCQSMHYIRDKLEEVSPDFGDLRARLAVAFELGPPCNDSINVDQVESFITTNDDVERAIAKMTDGGKVRITAKQITQRLVVAGMQFSYAHVLRCIRKVYGCEPKSIAQRDRVEIAATMLCENPGLITLIRSSRNWFVRIDQQYHSRLDSLQFEEVKRDARADDLCIAYQLVTGKLAPSLQRQSSKSSGYVANKLKHWSRPTPMNRMKVFDVISRTGADGICVDRVGDLILSDDSLAAVSANNAYADALRGSVLEIIDELTARRWIDVIDGNCVSRLKLHEAAQFTGHTANTLRKYCKIGMGPSFEMASFGTSRQLSFSYVALESWMDSRKEVSRVCRGNDPKRAHVGTASGCKSLVLFD